ncbi:MAG: xanthine dehydrogenase family protein [Myxococcales bacterium]|nr:xanthine dehydrogenase family protein [Myxococcales bacterium]
MATDPELRPPRYLGARVQRVEDPKFLRGRGQYLDDIVRPRMLHAAFLRSPFAHARIEGIDTSEARALPGVVAVFSAADLADDLTPLTTSMNRPEVQTASRTALAEKARHVGDPVAVVIAESRYTAEDAVDRIEIEWDPLPPVTDPEAALAADAPLVDEALPSNNIAHIEGGAGDLAAAFDAAAHVFRKRFVSGRSAGAPLEPRGVLADYEPSTGRLTVWCSSQAPHLVRTFTAPILGIPEGRMNVIAPDVGGGFGQKGHIFPEDVVIPAASRRLGRPVKWVSDRFEDLAASIHSKGMIAEVEIAVGADGRFLGIRGHYVSDGGGYSSMPFSPLVDSLLAGTLTPGPYDIANVGYIVDAPLTNKCNIGAIRGVGWVPGQLARETLIDEIARALRTDPVELRAKNLLGPEPQVTPLGNRLDGGSYGEALQAAADRLDYKAFRSEQERLRAEGRYLGIGFSPFIEPSGLGTELCHRNGMPVAFHDRASVEMEPDGSVVVTTGLHSHGQGHETSLAQVAADQLGVRLENVRVRYGDTEGAVYGMGTYASRSAVVGTGSIRLAAGEVRAKLQKLAGAMLEASPDDIELFDGKAQLRGAPVRSVPLSEIAGFGYFGGNARPDLGEESALTATRSYDPPETYSNGCCAIVAEVDIATGIVRLERVVAVEDCGVMLNPMIVEGQVSGAIGQGIGAALFEEAAYDEDGQFLAGSLMDYLYPVSSEIPEIEIIHIETPSTVTSGGVKGMGEAGTICAPAAVVNAVADALSPFGVSIDRTPITPSYVLDLLREAKRG